MYLLLKVIGIVSYLNDGDIFIERKIFQKNKLVRWLG